MPNQHNRPLYSVYRKKTGQPAYISGTSDECAKAMGVTRESFYSICSRIKTGSPACGKKWEVYQDEEDDLED